MTAKEILAKIKAVFDVIPATPAAPATPSGTVTPAPCSYNVDGGVPVFVDISDDGVPDIDMGDKVFTDQAFTIPYPDGTYTVTGTQFGFTVVAGAVSTVTDAAGTGPGTPVAAAVAPVTTPVPPPPTMEQRIAAIEAMLGKLTNPAAPAAMSTQKDVVELTADTVAEMYAKFGTGNSNDRLANLETMVKALMECNFGYQIRQGLESEAVQAYKDSIATQVSGLIASTQKFESHIATIDTQEEKIKKQDEIIKGFFELAEQLIQAPAADPVTINGAKKEKFERAQKKEEKFEAILSAITEKNKVKKY